MKKTKYNKLPNNHSWKIYGVTAICKKCSFTCSQYVFFRGSGLKNHFYWESIMDGYTDIISCSEYSAILKMDSALK